MLSSVGLLGRWKRQWKKEQGDILAVHGSLILGHMLFLVNGFGGRAFPELTALPGPPIQEPQDRYGGTIEVMTAHLPSRIQSLRQMSVAKGHPKAGIGFHS
jgi:hypothetical protein